MPKRHFYCNVMMEMLEEFPHSYRFHEDKLAQPCQEIDLDKPMLTVETFSKFC